MGTQDRNEQKAQNPGQDIIPQLRQAPVESTPEQVAAAGPPAPRGFKRIETADIFKELEPIH